VRDTAIGAPTVLDTADDSKSFLFPIGEINTAVIERIVPNGFYVKDPATMGTPDRSKVFVVNTVYGLG
jgi:hypothetical protein